LYQLYIQRNKFTFRDIEPNVGIVSFFMYSPQDSVGETQDTTVSQDSSLTISVSVGGEHSLYQWKKDGTIIPDATDSAYTIDSVSSVDCGSYICEIINTVATGLTLYSRPITISLSSAVPTPELPENYSMSVTKRIIADNQLEVRYALPEKAKVKFSIYDLSGARVREMSEENPAGVYSLKINMSGKPAGIYFLKVEAEDFTETKKLTILK